MLLINQKDKSNKFWKCENVDDLTLKITWGRIGGTSQEQIKTFRNQSAVQQFIHKKSSEKYRKGYKESTEKELKKEIDIAQKLGTQYKISKMQFVRIKDNTMHILNNYDPMQYVYVEVLNSWSKEVEKLVLSKDKSKIIRGSTTEYDRKIDFSGMVESSSKFTSTIRDVLKELARKVVSAVTFGAVGVRAFSLDDDDFDVVEEGNPLLSLYEEVGSSIDKQVVPNSPHLV